MGEQRSLLVYGLSAAAGLTVGFVLGRAADRFLSSTSQSSAGHRSVNSLLLEAMHFSAEKHKDQRRRNPKQTPYICHPVRVARTLAVDGSIEDVNVLIGALLHDTVEDTDATLDEIDGIFGERIASIVDEVSDDKTLPKERRKQLQVEHAPHISSQAKLVKLADKLDNLTDLLTDTPVGWGPDRVAEYFKWAEKVIDGLRGTNAVLEAKLDEVLAHRHVAIEAASRSVSS